MFKVIILMLLAFMSLNMNAEKSPHGTGMTLDCAICHQTDTWSSIKMNGFDHDATAFPLTGQHKSLECKSCHPTLVFEEARTSCASCHQDVHEQTLGNDCERCHSTNSWLVSDVSQLHRNMGFPLMGTHASLDCQACHQSASNLRFDRLGTNCVDCHLSNFQTTTEPAHVQAKFSMQCLDCHDQSSKDWSGAVYDHNFFPLTHGHALNCSSCHASGVYQGLPNTCESCHLDNYNATTTPNHRESGYPTNCAECHDTKSWMGANFDHSFFPLNDSHNVSCLSCHTNGTYKGLNSNCAGCHQKEYDATIAPIHSQAGYSTNCQECHNIRIWTDADLDHSIFPLTDAHNLSCTECHSSGIFKGLPNACLDCHKKDYDATMSPNHSAQGFSTNCEECHDTKSWLGANFDHSFFPLNDSHDLRCTVCHTNGTYQGLNTSCVSCHKSDYDNTIAPIHSQAGYSTNCQECHNIRIWTDATLDHSFFPLTDAHNLSCTDCHSSGVFKGLPNTCVDCHKKDYDATTQPNHAQVGYATTCTDCHDTKAWTNATLDHAFFPLTDAHNLSCTDCHSSGVFKGLPNTCVDCHKKDYDATTQPNHAQVGYATTCTDCHDTKAWTNATLDHSFFPLTNAHNLTCSACHSSGVYNGLPNTCVSCHQADYNGATNPNHASVGFSKDCQLCHNNRSWADANFNHDAAYFPIYSGKHKGEWSKCSECHPNASSYKVFTCISCHEHNQTDTNNDHKGVSGYVYNSANCYACHPIGRADD